MTLHQPVTMLVGELIQIAYNEYESFYEEPRSISYFAIQNKVGHDNIRVLDYVAEAIDLGCEDTQNDREKRSREEMVERIGHPTDEWWELTED